MSALELQLHLLRGPVQLFQTEPGQGRSSLTLC